MTRQKQLMFSMTEQIEKQLRDYAEERGISLSAVIKMALWKLFKEGD
jgi:uncharacterized protein YbaP (TraB family)